MGNALKTWLGVATGALMLAALFMVFVYVPTEAEEGIVQRIFYFHVPIAWVAFVAFGLVAIAGVFYLWLGQEVWDDLGYAAAETGMVFCTLMLITGSIWAKPIWGTWWTWDSRLTTMSDPVAALRRISGAARAGRRHAADRAHRAQWSESSPRSTCRS